MGKDFDVSPMEIVLAYATAQDLGNGRIIRPMGASKRYVRCEVRGQGNGW